MNLSFSRLVLAVGAALWWAAIGCESQRTFSSPDEAVAALTSAAESGDRRAIHELFGPRTNEMHSGDEEADAQDLATFRRELAESALVERQPDGTAVLLIGQERWPFAVPLVEQEKGWIFDTDRGIEELENRRIGRNELHVIGALRTVVDAQNEYRSQDRDGDGVLEYASKILSSPGKRDGLYWPSPGGVDPSPVGPALAAASDRTDDQGRRVPYAGYRFRLLTSQTAAAPGGAMNYLNGENLVGGWAVLAWPDEWDRTGVTSFLVSHLGTIYEADLGPDTPQAAAAITSFDPAAPWTPVAGSP